jgi:hypothetical protein
MNDRKPHITLPYNEVDFLWVSDHYDIHLSGICKYQGRIYEFFTEDPGYNEETDDWEPIYTKLFYLTRYQIIKWLLKKKMFEICVGYHWTYPNRKEGERFYYRNPQWLYTRLFKLYYKIKKIIRKNLLNTDLPQK